MLNASPEMLAELKWWLYGKAGSGACMEFEHIDMDPEDTDYSTHGTYYGSLAKGEKLVTVWHCHTESNGDCRNVYKTVRFVGELEDLIQYCTAALPGITVES
jgi:hypothetical protein